jgi:hypothetical protein
MDEELPANAHEWGLDDFRAWDASQRAKEPWTAYVRGFGEHIGTTFYETARLAREDSRPGERIYRITHIETVTQ